MSRTIRLSTYTWIVAALISLGALAPVIAHAETKLNKIKNAGFIRIGIGNEAPFSYTTPNGKLVGADIEILRHLLSEIGVKEIDPSVTTFGGLIPGLKAKRFDLVTSGIYIKPERCAQVAFGEPLYLQGDGIAVKAGNPKNIHSYQDVAKNSSIKIAIDVGAGAVVDNAEAMGVKPSQIVTIPNDISGYAAIKSGRVDGFATTSDLIAAQLKKANDPTFELATPFEQPSKNGKPLYALTSFAVRLGDHDLLNALNGRLLKFRKTGEYHAILKKYGLGADEVQPGITTAIACQNR